MEKHLEPKSLSFEYGGKEITLETGRIARQATAAVLVTVDQTQVLTTVVAKKKLILERISSHLQFFIKRNFMQQERFLVVILREKLDQLRKKH